MTKIMVAILEAYASDDRRRVDYARRGQRGVHRRRVDYARRGQRGVHRRRVDYARVAASKEFRRYANLARDLQRVDMFAVLACERLPFFQNLHNNAMAIHLCLGEQRSRPRRVNWRVLCFAPRRKRPAPDASLAADEDDIVF
jgi:hypothetical protein